MMERKDLADQYIQAIEDVKGEFSINDVRRAFETGYQMAELMIKLKQFEATDDDHQD